MGRCHRTGKGFGALGWAGSVPSMRGAAQARLQARLSGLGARRRRLTSQLVDLFLLLGDGIVVGARPRHREHLAQAAPQGHRGGRGGRWPPLLVHRCGRRGGVALRGGGACVDRLPRPEKRLLQRILVVVVIVAVRLPRAATPRTPGSSGRWLRLGRSGPRPEGSQAARAR